MQIKKENNQIVITLDLDSDATDTNNEVRKLLSLIAVNDRYSDSDLTFRSELVKQIKRSLVIGKIAIFDEPLLNEYQKPIATIDGYEDEVKAKFNEWYAKIAKEGEQVYFSKYSNKIEIRTKARKNQSYYNNDYKVVKTYYYQGI